MTTAHRPTWNSARGDSALAGSKLVQPKRNYSALDMPAHLKLKERQPGQGDSAEQSEIDFRSQLLKEERDRELKKKGITVEETGVKRLKTGIATSVTIKTPFPQDADEKFEDSSEQEESEEDKKSSEEESEEEEDEDDDELELLREYAKIKREREEEQRRKEIEKMQEIKKK